MSMEHFDILVEKFLDQTLSNDEQAELLSLVNQDSALRTEFEDRLTQLSMLRRIYRKKTSHSARAEIVALSKQPASMNRSAVRGAKTKKPRFLRWVLAAAAAAALIALAVTMRAAFYTPHDAIAVGSNNSDFLDLSDVVVESGQERKLDAEGYLGRTILTRERSKAFIRYKDGTTIDLDENTQLKLRLAEDEKGKELEAQSGRMVVNAAPQPKDRPT